MRVGVVGLGRMGAAMAHRLIETGHHVTVWNRSIEKARAIQGATIAETPAALAAEVDIILSILFDGAAVARVFDEIVKADLSNKLVIEMSTILPAAQQALAASIRAAGGAFIECPVGGTVGPARSGKLLGLVGGADADVAHALPVLNDLCRRVEHIGPVGAGAAMKLAINLPLAVFWQALGEANALIRHLRRDPVWLMDLFADTSGGANALKNRGPAVAAALAGQDGGAVTFDLDSIRKDLRTMLADAASRGFDLPVAARTLAVYDQAAAAGLGARDSAWVPAYWAEKADAPTPPTKLTLDRADIIIATALRTARERALAPLTVAVLDAGGHLVAFKREDRSGILRYDIATGKAWGALGMGFGSRELFNRAKSGPAFIGALTAASDGRVIPAPGGVLIAAADGDIIGAVGISGDASDADEACAIAGIEAAGFIAKPGA